MGLNKVNNYDKIQSIRHNICELEIQLAKLHRVLDQLVSEHQPIKVGDTVCLIDWVLELGGPGTGTLMYVAGVDSRSDAIYVTRSFPNHPNVTALPTTKQKLWTTTVDRVERVLPTILVDV